MSTVASRYVYFAMLGPAIIIGALIGQRRSPVPGLVGIAAVLVAGYLSYQETSFWQSDDLLWERALAANDASPLAHQRLAEAYRNEGRWEEAAKHYEVMLTSNPTMVEPRFYVGEAARMRGDFAQAADHL